MPAKTEAADQNAVAKPSKKPIIVREKERYQSHGFGAFFAIMQCVAFYYYWPTVMRIYWEFTLDFVDRNQISWGLFYMVCGVMNTLILIVSVQGFFAICYYFEFPFVERYKCLEEAWPWYDDPENW